jgi:hypothetical protein
MWFAVMDVAVLVAVLSGLWFGQRRSGRRSGWLEQATSRRLVVHTSDDRSIEGTVAQVGDDGLVLRAARLLGPKPVDMAGDVWVPRGRVLFVQTVVDAAP